MHLAVSYDPGRDCEDIFLFEVVGGFARGEINPERDLFETAFFSTPEFPLAAGEKLHLVLTSPEELSVALAEGWPLAIELRRAIRRGDFEDLFHDEQGIRCLELIRD